MTELQADDLRIMIFCLGLVVSFALGAIAGRFR